MDAVSGVPRQSLCSCPSPPGSGWEPSLGDGRTPPDAMVTGSWTCSQVTVHVHGQEVLSEETVPPGAEPTSPRELPDPPQTVAEESLEGSAQSPTLSPESEEQESLDHSPELPPAQESGGEPGQRAGFLGGAARCRDDALGSLTLLLAGSCACFLPSSQGCGADHSHRFSPQRFLCPRPLSFLRTRTQKTRIWWHYSLRSPRCAPEPVHPTPRIRQLEKESG